MAKGIVSRRKGKKREDVYREPKDIFRGRKMGIFEKNPNDMVLGQIGLLATYDTLILCFSAVFPNQII